MFHGIDRKTYIAVVELKDWPSEIWDLYEKEEIKLLKPTPVDEIVYPEKSSE